MNTNNREELNLDSRMNIMYCLSMDSISQQTKPVSLLKQQEQELNALRTFKDPKHELLTTEE